MGKRNGSAAAPRAAAATPRRAGTVLRRLERLYPRHPLNVRPADPFQVLVATVLSSRTKDPTTNAAMERLWRRASSPAAILATAEDELAELIKPVGFYRTKARQLHALSRLLLDEFGAEVPAEREQLMRLPGVGRKVANLVLNICFDTAAICVDTHVHRIANRLGWVATSKPEQTEQALMKLVPVRYWTMLNRVLVNHGQQVCQPLRPRCDDCAISRHCPRAGVTG